MTQSQTLSIGLVGGGGAAERLVQAAVNLDHVNIRSVLCRPAELSGAVRPEDRVQSYVELLQRTDINAVYLAAPVNTHVPLALNALSAQKHVLIEKPLALSWKDLQPLRLARVGPLVVGTAFKKRFGEGIETFCRMEWKLGAQTQAVYRWHIPPPAESNWRYCPELAGGGVVMDLGSHAIDLFEYLLGPIARVRAHTSSQLGTRRVESSAEIRVEFESGANGLIDLSWHANAAAFEFKIEEEGRRFYQRTASAQEDICHLSLGGRTRSLSLNRKAEYVGLLMAFKCAVNGLVHRLPSLEDGVRNISVIEAIYKAAESNLPIDVQP